MRVQSNVGVHIMSDKGAEALRQKLGDAVKKGEIHKVHWLLAFGRADAGMRVNEYSELPGLAAFGAGCFCKIPLLAYVVQSIIHGRAGRHARGRAAALRMVDVLLNPRHVYGRYPGARMDDTFEMYNENEDDAWLDQDHNDYTFKISEKRVETTVEKYVQDERRKLSAGSPEVSFLGSVEERMLLAKACRACDHLQNTFSPRIPVRASP